MDNKAIDKEMYEETKAKRDAALKMAKEAQEMADFLNQLLEELAPKGT